jgi:hypothetical protein
MSTPQPTRRSYLISVTTRDQAARTAMRNALWRLRASEVLPGLFLVALTDGERATLTRRFGEMRIKER